LDSRKITTLEQQLDEVNLLQDHSQLHTMPRVVVITGASRGLGHELAQVFLSSGDCVVATSRDPSTFSFEHTTTANYLPLKLDVTSPSATKQAFDATLEKFGRIDIVINNAAFGLIGPLETLSDRQVRDQFDTNFFPVVRITRKSIEIMRTQSPVGGIILQISTIGSSLGAPLVGIMSASKKAVEIFTESAQQEIKPEWNIKLISIQLGSMDTDAHAKSMVYGDVNVEAYDHMDAKAFVGSLQPTISTRKAAVAIERMLHLKDMPGKVLLVGEAFRAIVKAKVEQEMAQDAKKVIIELAESCEI
jgi:NAD(P)-dependent dehydrogenase (short-subunit alcohol dehydrogenase family)